jgi:hypothetical protein
MLPRHLQGYIGGVLPLLHAAHPEGTFWDELLLARPPGG